MVIVLGLEGGGGAGYSHAIPNIQVCATQWGGTHFSWVVKKGQFLVVNY